MTKAWARAACSHPALPGVSGECLGELVAELAPKREARQESALRDRRRSERRREAGAGPKHRLVFVDRVVVALAKLRHDLPDAALAELFGVDRSTVSGAVRQLRPLLAARGFAVPDQPGLRLRTPMTKKARETASLGDLLAWREARRRQSSRRICVEHANAEYKQWRPMQRYTGRRQDFAGTQAAIAGLVSDRSAQRETRPQTSTDLVPVRPATC